MKREKRQKLKLKLKDSICHAGESYSCFKLLLKLVVRSYMQRKTMTERSSFCENVCCSSLLICICIYKIFCV